MIRYDVGYAGIQYTSLLKKIAPAAISCTKTWNVRGVVAVDGIEDRYSIHELVNSLQ